MRLAAACPSAFRPRQGCRKMGLRHGGAKHSAGSLSRGRRRQGANATSNECIVVSNDDGVDSPLTLQLAEALRAEFDYRVLVVAPAANKSASSMSLTLRQDMRLDPRADLGPDTYALHGTPADCMLVTMDPGQGVLRALDLSPVLCIVGPNYGANVSADILCSGTVSAARMAAMMGVPAIATSSTLVDRLEGHPGVIEATIEVAQAALHVLQETPTSNWPRSYFPLPQRGRRHWSHSSRYADIQEWESEEAARLLLLKESFQSADIFLNVNVSRRWDPSRPRFFSTSLGLMFYRDQFQVEYDPERSTPIPNDTIDLNSQTTTDLFGRGLPLRGQATDRSEGPSLLPRMYHNKFNTRLSEDVEGGDLWALQQGGCSITTLQTWPEAHPLCLKDVVMAAAQVQANNGLPAWMDTTSAIPVDSRVGLRTSKSWS